MLDRIVEEIQKNLNSIFKQWDVLLWQLLATIVLIIAIRFLVWKPITKFLESKQEAIQNELAEVQKEKAQYEQVKQDSIVEYETMKSETKKIKETIINDAQAEKTRIIEEAREEAKRRLNKADQDIAQEIKDSEEKIKQTIKDVAFVAAEKILQKEIGEDSYEDMLNEIIDKNL